MGRTKAPASVCSGRRPYVAATEYTSLYFTTVQLGSVVNMVWLINNSLPKTPVTRANYVLLLYIDNTQSYRLWYAKNGTMLAHRVLTVSALQAATSLHPPHAP